MRKDAKIGFAIGGVLLAVLTVYATVVTKHPKKTISTVSLVNPVPADVPTPTPMIASGSGTGTTQPPVTTPPTDLAPPAHTDAPVNSTAPTDTTASTPPAPNVAVTLDPKPDATASATPDRQLVPDAPPEVHVKPAKVHTAEMEVATPAPSGDRTYVIQSGQTLSSIASEIYGNPRFWVAIQRENKSINPNHLRVGDKINLPDITPIRPGTVEQAADVEVASPGAVHHDVSPAAVTDGHTYVVKSGDSLYRIARTVLGSGRKADALYALNKDVIGPDKSRLKLGMVLKLPESAAAGLAIAEPVR